MSDYRVTVKVRNARLLRAISNAGYQSIPKFSAAAGVQYSQVNGLLNMTASPLDKRGNVRPMVEAIMDFLCEPFDALFSEAQCEALATNKTERDVSAEQVFALLCDYPQDPLEALCAEDNLRRADAALALITPRAASVLRRRFGIDGEAETANQISKALDVTASRVHVIEQESLRKIRMAICKSGNEWGMAQ